jgi:hypothetical protein
MSGRVHFDMSWTDYRALKRLNFSTLKHMARSPLHYAHAVEWGDAPKPSYSLGAASHCALLEPGRFDSEFVVYSKRRQSKEWDAFEAEHVAKGHTILTQAEYREATAMAAAVRRNPLAAKYLAAGNAEVRVTWDLESPPLGATPGFRFECKAGLDWLTPDAIVEFKSTRDASKEAFEKDVERYRYHTQAAFQVDGHQQATGRRLPHFIIAVESHAPYASNVFRVGEELLRIGREEYTTLLGRLDDCRRTKTWAGYSETELELELPRWAKRFEETLEVA